MSAEEIEKLEKTIVECTKILSKYPRRLAFAEGWAQGKKQARAYEDAGYKSKNPTVDAFKAVEAYPDISRYRDAFIALSKLKSVEDEIGTFQQKRKMLWEAAQRCMQEVLPKYEGHGDEKELVGYVFDSKAIPSLIGELNRMDGDHAVVRMKSDTPVDEFADLTDDEIKKEIAELQEKLGT